MPSSISVITTLSRFCDESNKRAPNILPEYSVSMNRTNIDRANMNEARMNQRRLRILALLICFVSLPASLCAQTAAAQAAAAKAVPSIDGGVGPCTADLTITDESGAPVYAAKVSVHIAYGFASVRKLDLELGTNADGKARFIGIPDRMKRGIYFRASEGERSGEAFDDPANTCKAELTIKLEKKPQ